jgi:hypothetical protein
LVECIGDDGQLCLEKYLQYSARESEADDILLQLTLRLVSRGNMKEVIRRKKQKGRARRKHKALVPYYFDDDGTKVQLRPRQTSWYHMYVKSPALDNDKFNKKFRRRFRMSHAQFQVLLEKIREDETFRRWHLQKQGSIMEQGPRHLSCSCWEL